MQFPTPRLLPSRGLQRRPLVVDDRLAFSLPATPSSSSSRQEICITPHQQQPAESRFYERWSPNTPSPCYAFYPGPSKHPLPEASFYPVEPHLRRLDGSLGRFDWSRAPQHFDALRPWLGLVERPISSKIALNETNPELVHAPLVWSPNYSGGWRGTLDRAYLVRLIRRNEYLDARISSLLSSAKQWNLHRPLRPDSHDMTLLSEELDWAAVVDWLVAAQRGIREKAAWIRMVNFRLSSMLSNHTISAIENIPQSNARYIGVWLNGASEEDASWLLRARVPCYIIHQYKPGIDYPLSKHHRSIIKDRRLPQTFSLHKDFYTHTFTQHDSENNPYLFVTSRSEVWEGRFEWDEFRVPAFAAEEKRDHQKAKERSASWRCVPPSRVLATLEKDHACTQRSLCDNKPNREPISPPHTTVTISSNTSRQPPSSSTPVQPPLLTPASSSHSPSHDRVQVQPSILLAIETITSDAESLYQELTELDPQAGARIVTVLRSSCTERNGLGEVFHVHMLSDSPARHVTGSSLYADTVNTASAPIAASTAYAFPDAWREIALKWWVVEKRDELDVSTQVTPDDGESRELAPSDQGYTAAVVAMHANGHTNHLTPTVAPPSADVLDCPVTSAPLVKYGITVVEDIAPKASSYKRPKIPRYCIYTSAKLDSIRQDVERNQVQAVDEFYVSTQVTPGDDKRPEIREPVPSDQGDTTVYVNDHNDHFTPIEAASPSATILDCPTISAPFVEDVIAVARDIAPEAGPPKRPKILRSRFPRPQTSPTPLEPFHNVSDSSSSEATVFPGQENFVADAPLLPSRSTHTTRVVMSPTAATEDMITQDLESLSNPAPVVSEATSAMQDIPSVLERPVTPPPEPVSTGPRFRLRRSRASPKPLAPTLSSSSPLFANSKKTQQWQHTQPQPEPPPPASRTIMLTIKGAASRTAQSNKIFGSSSSTLTQCPVNPPFDRSFDVQRETDMDDDELDLIGEERRKRRKSDSHSQRQVISIPSASGDGAAMPSLLTRIVDARVYPAAPSEISQQPYKRSRRDGGRTSRKKRKGLHGNDCDEEVRS